MSGSYHLYKVSRLTVYSFNELCQSNILCLSVNIDSSTDMLMRKSYVLKVWSDRYLEAVILQFQTFIYYDNFFNIYIFCNFEESVSEFLANFTLRKIHFQEFECVSRIWSRLIVDIDTKSILLFSIYYYI